MKLNHIVIAMDSFKESLTALEACQVVQKGFVEVLGDACKISLVPMADGGEGTVQALVDATGGELVWTAVTDPLGHKIESFYGLLGDGKTAVIEMAAASGLALVPPEQRNPLLTSSVGTGELILAALNQGANSFILGLGGSATNDGGIGMASALGVEFFNAANEQIHPVGGGDLASIARISTTNMHPKVATARFVVACDVDNPLTGERGASAIFGPQKGATPAMVQQLDTGMKSYAVALQTCVGKDVASTAGAGAAGGLGAACMGYLNATLQSGVSIVTEVTNLAAVVATADLVITGEGRVDGQTAFGKTPMGVAKVAKQFNLPVIALAGCLGDNYENVFEVGIDSVLPILSRLAPLDEVLKDGSTNLYKAARNLARILKVAQ